ncbi:MAG: 3-deoxy-D-manno-octulosonic acid transferase [Candidatus Omnitrophica bacterium]|nr:3-deoxy-D-manno-octulosonic acid transferase [Candidatus Omnitrophota bacterium]
MFFLFDLCFLIYILFYLPIMLLRGKWHNGMKARLGFIPDPILDRLRGRRNIWLHAVSVGEVMAVEGMIRRLREQFPDRQIILSVTTRAGHALARRRYADTSLVIWSPLDLSLTVRIFVAAIRPEIYIAAETELWPNLFARLAQERVKILIVNGRISDAAFPRYRLVRGWLKSVLAKVSLFCMQSDLDVRRIVELGAPSERVVNVGNVKFDLTSDLAQASPGELGLEPGKLVWVAGSTHPGEEELVLGVYESLCTQFPDLRLVVAPRHPERAPGIVQMIAKSGLIPILFSTANRKPLGAGEVLVVDTIGHLVQFYSVATVVFVGKSLTVRGGHNIIEPGIFGKPVLVGPHMQNFMDITRAFMDSQAVVQVPDATALRSELERLLASSEERGLLGQRARDVIQRNRGATERTIKIITRIYGVHV